MDNLTARTYSVLDARIWGILSSVSSALPGFPVGSVVSYAMLKDSSGIRSPYFCLSDISEHTINAKLDNRVSLTVWRGDECEPQKLERVTWIGRLMASPDMEEPFLEEMPSCSYMKELRDFRIYVLELERVRLIGGFAQAYWVEREDVISHT